MGVYQKLKTVVPLEWRVAVRSSIPQLSDKALRVRNRVDGGLPIPEPDLIFLVAGHRNTAWFLRGGATASEAIRETLNKQGLKMENFNDILDFGCGVGRIIRHWQGLPGNLNGTDYNSRLIDWCKRNLKFAKFQTNTLDGKLSYGPESFDFIYAFSVFTHMTEPLQFHWMRELSRILRPGGYLYFTTHGESFFAARTPEQRARLERGEMVVVEDEQPGTNYCGAYHPYKYVREKLSAGFDFIDWIPQGAKGDSQHDVYLLRKPL